MGPTPHTTGSNLALAMEDPSGPEPDPRPRLPLSVCTHLRRPPGCLGLLLCARAVARRRRGLPVLVLIDAPVRQHLQEERGGHKVLVKGDQVLLA